MIRRTQNFKLIKIDYSFYAFGTTIRPQQQKRKISKQWHHKLYQLTPSRTRTEQNRREIIQIPMIRRWQHFVNGLHNQFSNEGAHIPRTRPYENSLVKYARARNKCRGDRVGYSHGGWYGDNSSEDDGTDCCSHPRARSDSVYSKLPGREWPCGGAKQTGAGPRVWGGDCHGGDHVSREPAIRSQWDERKTQELLS